MPLKLFNTLSRNVETFSPLAAPKVGFYSCGPTVYWFAHLGNMRPYVVADTLQRYLRFCGYQVTHVMNITDVGHLVADSDDGEDKMILAMRREGKSAYQIAEFYTTSFFKDCASLNIKRPDVVCKATEHVPQQIEMIKKLEARGYTYRTSDGIYFDTQRFPEYGALARLDIAGLEAGKRIAVGEKRSKTDFALWKFSPTSERREMEWDSPWGRGFPGWHIECSAMAAHYLGASFDIHSGGVDHISIHHTNEIAQSECASGVRPFVKYWLHSEFLVFGDDVKMSKSKGNILTVQTLLDRGFDPLAHRFLLLSTHYRKQLSFSFEALEGAARGLERLKDHVREVRREASEPKESSATERYRNLLGEALDDDLNTPVAIAHLWEALKDGALSAAEKLAVAAQYDALLGLSLTDPSAALADSIPAEVQALIASRDAARAEKRWADSDTLRDKISALGYDVLDSKAGTQVKRRREALG